MAASNTNATGGGFLGLMFLIFMTLKLTGFIEWSWWWVTAPLWIPVALFAALCMLVVCIALVKN